ncbi:GGDEF domain-containing protein [Catenulispora sp. NF23]|uniref:GGDEF domain-containing protein n=1 Tax=Catenulispora pinistramenti TaxID=2705254 RepID=A0ABS5KPW8_9ACTN|nr:GGDEF domain-containing protein [Catenulispora pinistramenti]MBS2535295.1 GGDEF domain-containing protein [Catenulispora pinistramenti]MBS2548098.1 GGDEF domain-containing protein [Catenulispora pinistramenti]
MGSELMVCLTTPAAAVSGFLAGLAAMRRRVRRATGEAAHARWLADHDALTGLPNRTAARQHYQHAARAGRPPAAALLDLDDFKTVNDTWGHQVGDTHLVAVGERLAAACRDVGARAFRLGGDEFVLLLPSADPRVVLRDVTAIVGVLGAPQYLKLDEIRSVTLVPSASAGIAVSESGDTFSDVLRRADIALYHAKRYGCAVPRLYTPDLRQPWSHRHKTVEEMHPDRVRVTGLIAEQATR